MIRSISFTVSRQLVDESFEPQSWRCGVLTLPKFYVHFLDPRRHVICWPPRRFLHFVRATEKWGTVWYTSVSHMQHMTQSRKYTKLNLFLLIVLLTGSRYSFPKLHVAYVITPSNTKQATTIEDLWLTNIVSSTPVRKIVEICWTKLRCRPYAGSFFVMRELTFHCWMQLFFRASLEASAQAPVRLRFTRMMNQQKK